jgi:hypothetical protein
VADALPRIKAIAAQVNHDGIAASHVGEDEDVHFWIGTIHHGSKKSPDIFQLYRDKFAGNPLSYVLAHQRRQVLDPLHNLCHPEK